MEQRVVPIRSHSVPITSEFPCQLDLLPVVQNVSDAETITNYRQGNNGRTPLFKVANSVGTLLNTEESISVTTSSVGRIYIVPRLNSIRNGMVLPASGIVPTLLPVPSKIRVASFSKKLTTLPKPMLIGVKSDLSELIVHLYQSATIPYRERKNNKSVADSVASDAAASVHSTNINNQ